MNGKKSIKRKLKMEKGSYVVESAIIIPIFIVAALSIIIFIRAYETNWKVNNILKDEVGLSAARASVLETDIFLRGRIDKRINEIGNINVNDVNISYSLKYKDFDNLVRVALDYSLNIKVPIFAIGDYNKTAQALGRKFVGDIKSKETVTFDDMERDDDSHIVYVFPRDGERFHRLNCRVVAPKAEKVLLSDDIRASYTACEVCCKKKIDNGDTVIVFNGYGKRFHLSQCSFIKKQIEKIQRKTAEEKGYSPCKICHP